LIWKNVPEPRIFNVLIVHQYARKHDLLDEF
jgi:hypothetical protein